MGEDLWEIYRVKLKNTELNKKIGDNYLKVFLVFLWDALFFILISIGFFTIANKTSKFAQGYMDKVDFGGLFSSNLEVVNSNYAALKMVLFWLIFWLVLFFIVYLLLLTLFKGTLWLKLNGEKISWKILSKYFFMNVVYVVPMTILSIWMYFRGRLTLLFFVVLIFFYFYTVSSYYLAKKGEVLKTLKLTFTKGFDANVIFNYLLAVILFFILNHIFSIYSFSFKIVFNTIFYTIYLSIFKVWMNNVFGEALK